VLDFDAIAIPQFEFQCNGKEYKIDPYEFIVHMTAAPETEGVVFLDHAREFFKVDKETLPSTVLAAVLEKIQTHVAPYEESVKKVFGRGLFLPDSTDSDQTTSEDSRPKNS
jgi:hypothetical protein